MAKESFILHTDVWPALKQLNIEQRGLLFTALMCYQTGEPQPQLDIQTQMAFMFMASQMDRDNQKYDQVSAKRRNAANARWSKQKMQKHNLHYDTETDTDSDTVTDTETENESPKGDSSCIGANARTTKTTKSSWRAPSVDEVQAYCWERGNSVDPEAFVDYYEANGWMVGRSHMKDWKAAVRTWERKETTKGGSSSGMFMAEAERLEREGWS